MTPNDIIDLFSGEHAAHNVAADNVVALNAQPIILNRISWSRIMLKIAVPASITPQVLYYKVVGNNILLTTMIAQSLQ